MKRFLLSIALTVTFFSAARAQSPVRLEGQVVCCEDCWAKADRKIKPYGTRADLEQAAQCIAKGDPTLLAVANSEGGFTMYQLEGGKFRRPGKNWLEFVGKRIEVTGSTGKRHDKSYVKVDALSILAEPIASSEPEVNVIGKEAELSLKDLAGVEQRISGYRGRIVVLNFWATYCVPCRKEMPDLAAIQNEYASLGLQVIGAAADTVEDKQKVMKFIKDAKLNFPIWLGASSADMQSVGLSSVLPGTVIIGRDGKIVGLIKGVIKPAELRKQIESWLVAADKDVKQGTVAVNRSPAGASSVPS